MLILYERGQTSFPEAEGVQNGQCPFRFVRYGRVDRHGRFVPSFVLSVKVVDVLVRGKIRHEEQIGQG